MGIRNTKVNQRNVLRESYGYISVLTLFAINHSCVCVYVELYQF